MGRQVKQQTREQQYQQAIANYDNWQASASNRGRKPPDPRTDPKWADVRSGGDKTQLKSGQSAVYTEQDLKIQRGQRYILETDTKVSNRGRLGTKYEVAGYRQRVLHDPPKADTADESQLSAGRELQKKRRKAQGTARLAGKSSNTLTIGGAGSSALSIAPTKTVGPPT